MKILTAIKRVVDYNVKVRVRSDGTGVELNNVKMSMNPFDEIAVEEALRLKEAGHAEEVVAVSIGSEECQETLRAALAMGADRAILVKVESTNYQPLSIAKVLQKIVEQEQPQLVFMGKQAIDDDCNQTGQMLAALLDWPQGTFASHVQLSADRIEVTREVDAGMETVRLTLPTVITSDLRLNEPRFTTLPNIMKAKQKPLNVIDIDELGLSLTEHVQQLRVDPPEERSAGVMLDSMSDLVAKLQQQHGVI